MFQHFWEVRFVFFNWLFLLILRYRHNLTERPIIPLYFSLDFGISEDPLMLVKMDFRQTFGVVDQVDLFRQHTFEINPNFIVYPPYINETFAHISLGGLDT